MQCTRVSFRTIFSKCEYNAMASFQTSINIDKTRHKYCLLSFMHRNKIGLLTLFAKINNKDGGLNNVCRMGKNLEISKQPPLVLTSRECSDKNDILKFFSMVL